MPKTQMPELRTPKGLFESTSLTGKGNAVYEIELDRLVTFASHPFKLYEGEKLNDLVESIRANGVMVPIIVRELGDLYEILSGHNRVAAAKLAGLETIPTIIRKVADDEAILIVTSTNLIQREFAQMAHSERAAVLSAHHNAMKKQGHRSDLVNEIENLLKASNDGENSTSSPVGHKLKSRDKTGIEYALSKNTVTRYLRVNTLIDALKESLDNGAFGVRVAVALSYLAEETQHHVSDVLGTGYKLDMEKAEALRKKKPTTRTEVEQILGGHKPRQQSPFKLKPKLVSKYFAGSSQKEIEATLVAALDMYFASKQKDE